MRQVQTSLRFFVLEVFTNSLSSSTPSVKVNVCDVFFTFEPVFKLKEQKRSQLRPLLNIR